MATKWVSDLVFLRNDFTFYSPEFMQLIASLYDCNDNYSELSVCHLRMGAAPMGVGDLIKAPASRPVTPTRGGGL